MKPILIVGDIHGKWGDLLADISKYAMHGCTLIGVGDLGIGFIESTKQVRQFEYLCNFFVNKNIEFLGIRGNHDDPKYFDGSINYPNFKLLSDYTSLTLNDKQFLFVGGAISVDRTLRKEGVSYWKDEVFNLDHSKIQRCDVLITHSAPTWNGPIEKNAMLTNFCLKDPILWDECMQERKQHDILIKLASAKRHYCGHFHTHSVVDFDGCVSTILDELEIAQLS